MLKRQFKIIYLYLSFVYNKHEITFSHSRSPSYQRGTNAEVRMVRLYYQDIESHSYHKDGFFHLMIY